MAGKKEQFALDLVRTTSALLWQYQRLVALEDEWAKLGYGAGAPNEITDGDLAGLDMELTAGDLAGGLVTLGAIRALMDQGHGTNIHRLYRRGV